MDFKLKRILLVDDNDSDNFLHERVLKKAKVAQEIVVVNSGEMALDFLTTELDEGYPTPDLIILDINMPRMNGWEFLEEYKKLDDSCKGNTVTVMLSTSLNPEDRERAEKDEVIQSFLSKPLTKEQIFDFLKSNQVTNH